MYLLEAEGLSYTYPDGTEALRGVNFRLARGEAVAVLGANGAGKTTLLRHFNGLLTPTSGRLMLCGEELHRGNLMKARRIVGLVFQNPDEQLFAPSVAEDVAFGPRNLGLDEEEVERRVEEALHLVGMEGSEERAPHHLSYGEKKRIAIAGVLAMKPECIALDEPTSGLDPAGAEELIELLNRLRRSGISIVFATHDVDMVPLLAERVYLLHGGRMVCEGTPEHVFSSPELERCSLRAPCAARLLQHLRIHGVDVELRLTVEEAAKELAKLC